MVSNEIRRLILLIEDMMTAEPSADIQANATTQLSPQLARYIERYPDYVADDPQTLIARMKESYRQNPSRYAWCIARLPDGRYLECFPNNAKQWGLTIVQQGNSFDFAAS